MLFRWTSGSSSWNCIFYLRAGLFTSKSCQISNWSRLSFLCRSHSNHRFVFYDEAIGRTCHLARNYSRFWRTLFLCLGTQTGFFLSLVRSSEQISRHIFHSNNGLCHSRGAVQCWWAGREINFTCHLPLHHHIFIELAQEFEAAWVGQESRLIFVFPIQASFCFGSNHPWADQDGCGTLGRRAASAPNPS